MKSVLFKIKIDESLSLVMPHLSCAREIFSLIDKDRDHLRAWLPWVDSTTTAEDTHKNISGRIEGFKKMEQASFYGTLNGKFVASVGFISLTDDVGEIGYWLLSEYGGKGLMTSFVNACIDYGFNELKLNKIIIKCAEGNIKSAGIPRRLGFTQTEKSKTKRIRNGGEYNTLTFTLARNDWSK